MPQGMARSLGQGGWRWGADHEESSIDMYLTSMQHCKANPTGYGARREETPTQTAQSLDATLTHPKRPQN